MTKTFNMEMNIAKAIGIFAVVAGHCGWNIFGDFFRNYCWHMPFFFFIAGYFFNENAVNGFLANLFKFIKKVGCKYLGIFYLYHFFYGGMTWLVYISINRLYGKLPTLKNLTISPFDSTPYTFDTPNWFLYTLAVSICCFAILMYISKKINQNKYFPFAIFLPLAILATFIAKPNFGASHGIMLVLIRISFSMFYIYMGYLYRHSLENKVQFNLKTLFYISIINLLINLFCNNHANLNIHQGRIYHNISPFIVPFCGIYFVLFISKLIAPLVKEGSLIDKIGRNSLHIMANHVFVIFLIVAVIFIIDGTSFEKFPKKLIGGFYKLGKYKFLYTFTSVIICTYLGEYLRHIGNIAKAKISQNPIQKPCVPQHDAPAAP